jgi:glycerophosphoryl diester phosphodiesterase
VVPRPPLVFAHRGSSAARAEHTLEAYRLALDEGVDGVECDVRLTRDGHPVCIHDGRLERTSDGRGRVSAATLAELRRLDFASWHATPRGPTTPGGVLTLDELVGLVRDAGRPVRLLIETKHPSRYGAALEDRVVEVLRRHRLVPLDPDGPVQLTMMSFAPTAVRRIRQLVPGLPTGFLFELALPALRGGRVPYGAEIVGPGISVVRAHPDLVRRCHDRGRAVYVWTVNEPADVALVVDLGVDGIITDRPTDVLAHLGRGARR